MPFQSVSVRSKVWLEVDGQFAVGEGGIALFEAIAERGSVRQAAAAIGWSYRHAWDYLRRIEAAFGTRLIETSPMQPSAGTRLTPEGEVLLQGLQKLRTAVRLGTERAFRTSFPSARAESRPGGCSRGAKGARRSARRPRH